MGPSPPWLDCWATASLITFWAVAQRAVIGLVQRKTQLRPTCSSRLTELLQCLPVQRRLVLGSTSQTKPRLFGSPWVPLRPLVRVPSVTKARALETERSKGGTHGSTFCFLRWRLVVIACILRHTIPSVLSVSKSYPMSESGRAWRSHRAKEIS